jgi:hypothetical protein
MVAAQWPIPIGTVKIIAVISLFAYNNSGADPEKPINIA